MNLRDRFALTLPPLLIRLVLAFTFIWAGAGKLRMTEVSGETAALLANLGVKNVVNLATPTPTTPTHPTDQSPANPDNPAANPDSSGNGAAVPPADNNESEKGSPAENPSLSAADQFGNWHIQLVQNEQPASQGDDDAEQDTPPAQSQNESQEAGNEATPAAVKYTAEQFTKPIPVRRLYTGVVPLLHANGWQRPVQLAWLATLSELIGGLLLIPGILSRLAALSLVGVMAGAMWLTTIQPSMNNPDAFLHVWPDLNAAYGTREWISLITAFWQLALGVMALAIFLGGPGRISIDSIFFGPRSARKSNHKKANYPES